MIHEIPKHGNPCSNKALSSSSFGHSCLFIQLLHKLLVRVHYGPGSGQALGFTAPQSPQHNGPWSIQNHTRCDETWGAGDPGGYEAPCREPNLGQGGAGLSEGGTGWTQT